ncbi:alpha/beta hydrolase [Candidatus Bipolaricaulota bacterium]|nr:alpha/beta hydrolase [Candidatus Bipolaricaulota bacterium]
MERKNLQYGSEERHELDIYEPAEINNDTEIILFIYGGGWESGDKGIHKFVGRAWARHNFIVILPNYRLAPEATYPAQLHDIVRSIKWLQDNYEEFSDTFYLAGHSAGANLASLVGFSDRWLAEAELEPENIRGFVLLSGVYQFYPFEKADPRVRSFLGDKRYWEEAQPINIVNKSTSPVFLAHGKNDSEVLPAQTIQLSERLEALNVEHKRFIEEGAGHIGLLLNTTKQDTLFWNSLNEFFGRND